MDIALFASLALAVPAAMLSELLVVRTVPAWQQHGRLFRNDRGSIEAVLMEASQDGAPWQHARPYGTFELLVPQQNGGFPLVTSLRPLAMRVELDLFTEPNLDAATALSPGAPVHGAIDAAVRGEGGRVQAVWEGERLPVTRRWAAMAMNGVFWWFAMYIVSTVGIALLRGGAHVMSQHRAARKKYWRDIGKCAACGYDMRGLEFASRCPECGELV